MAYHLYNTEALVCGSRDSNTSDRAYILFTREAGMIWAQTKSVREERSKHRYALQDFSVIRVSLVHGKAGWRIVGTEPSTNLYYDAKERDVRILLRNVVRLLRRVIRGEEATPELYDDLLHTLKAVPKDVAASEMETVLTLRVLHALGYIAPQEVYQNLLEDNAYETRTPEGLRKASQVIEGALTASHL
ncbi:recombination protein O N-terminal domain-containing protein [Candidatus Kaiserbacteria bacterium]|nr:recombination protein O N-terminal domain-containing protein [Candidatus Kaiserbacteria bacterium]